ncbi:DUF72 domain-containing protein [Pontibacter sp. SGAir0037]|uniref:DUF72 domain-containing protein n=1 Tax=Pontibacter sp. SGAir0037 TaxID=2571030 RepID=UPI0010CD1BB8|nr:DUF72 domain-containing protein [Pontibacter sp. SGAir0037]QCR21446.1 DUF72 domain-containing protein [Pontibacter sp. SGAir0037]
MICIGTSGWHYKHWMGNFYPHGLRSKGFTDYYTRFFSTVEINNSFYKLPSAETFVNWRASVPDNFLFAVKASRFITHMKKLKDPQESIARFFGNVNALEEKLGPVLFQLPPMWSINLERLRSFLAQLPPYYRYTFEFRHPSWYHPAVYDLLRQYQAAFCIYELEYHQSPFEVTSNFVYVRLHGPEAKYCGSYTEETLRWWVDNCRAWHARGLDIYIYFDNDQNGYAAFNAQRLQELVREQIVC